ncbi:SDR family oxidoreductase [Aquibacillus sp. 3ASR75-11]|uniref:SDR family oxidoreductase n=1 Tax=Terrihalobacillus insolitus TaxID=2950438 RepID=A0A9X3WRH9_9BACI|nr:SDR family oxidoreductase [Terrihalobacillus insolitus]MDC3412655.1 SDR family oxidoreductase [Terrihalobacillus insolitus]MDC3424005.1 SDR family oxidoreductase [Terrihalobacillus insolitus]
MGHALITAGTKGLGKKVTEAFLEKGHNVTVSYRSDVKKAEELLTAFSSYKNNVQLIQADVTIPEDLESLVQQAVAKFGGIDYLINNAGPFIFDRKKLMDYTQQEWDDMIRGNLDSFFHLLKLTIPHMRNNRFGRVITYGFQGAHTAAGWLYRSAFAAAKVGLVSLTKTIAYEEAEYGITSNMVCPGNIVGEMKEASINESRLIPNKETPIGRSGTGADIARTVLFLCEDDSDMITGSVFEITGGLDVIHRYR